MWNKVWCVLSDVHSNLPALEHVWKSIEKRHADSRVIVIGDLIGYGPRPNEVCKFARARDFVVIKGNHERALEYIARHGEAPPDFNPAAQQAISWQFEKLTNDNKVWLGSLPDSVTYGPVEFHHGSTFGEDEYVTGGYEADRALRLSGIETKLVVVGHTHKRMEYEDYGKKLVNPGSVGQPRDGDTDAKYIAIGSDGRVLGWYASPYDNESVAREIFSLGLPRFLGQRLLDGM